MNERDEGTKAGVVLDWDSEQDPKFEAELAKQSWVVNTAFEGLVLQGACPICNHQHAIDVFVPTTTATFKVGVKVGSEYVECSCGENHNQPPGGKGCGRWGYVTPRVTSPD